MTRAPSGWGKRCHPPGEAPRAARLVAGCLLVTLASCAPWNQPAPETAHLAKEGAHPASSDRVVAPFGARRPYLVTQGFGFADHRGEDWAPAPNAVAARPRAGAVMPTDPVPTAAVPPTSSLGAPVVAIADGEVLFAGNADRDGFRGWGNVVIVRHRLARGFPLPDEAVETLYGHLEDIRVSPGTLVRAGQPVGTVGTGGGRYAPHLHFEVRERLGLGIQAGSGSLDGWLAPSEWLAEHGALTAPATAAASTASSDAAE